MSVNKLIVPGFGIGSAFGTPFTVALAPTQTVTLTGTVLPAGQYMIAGLVAGTNFSLVSTSNGVTGTWVILSGGPGSVDVYDGASGVLINTTTSINVTFIAT